MWILDEAACQRMPLETVPRVSGEVYRAIRPPARGFRFRFRSAAFAQQTPVSSQPPLEPNLGDAPRS